MLSSVKATDNYQFMAVKCDLQINESIPVTILTSAPYSASSDYWFYRGDNCSL